MVEYKYVIVLKTRQPLLRVKLNFDSRKYSEKRTTPHTAWSGALFYEIVIVNKKLPSWNATIQNTAKCIYAYAETDPVN